MKQQTFDATIASIAPITAFIEEWLEQLGCSFKALTQINVAVDELLSNIARYAYQSGTGKVTIQMDFEAPSRTASITFIDSGTPYNPLEKPDPDVTLSANQRAIGGLGIFLVKKTMDKLEYRHENGFNMLTIRKHI